MNDEDAADAASLPWETFLTFMRLSTSTRRTVNSESPEILEGIVYVVDGKTKIE